jgi:hypothetical protein
LTRWIGIELRLLVTGKAEAGAAREQPAEESNATFAFNPASNRRLVFLLIRRYLEQTTP